MAGKIHRHGLQNHSLSLRFLYVSIYMSMWHMACHFGVEASLSGILGLPGIFNNLILIDSRTYRNFCRIGLTHKGFSKSALCKNIKAISSSTWESINRFAVAYGEDKKIRPVRLAVVNVVFEKLLKS